MSLLGAKFPAYPTRELAQIFSQWMGCSRFVWNAKCEENDYFYRFKQKFLPITTQIPIDQSCSQFKSKELSPWLAKCPSQILRNAMTVWGRTMSAFLQGKCGRPKKKRKEDGGSIWLTSELFRFKTGSDGTRKLFIGTQANEIGCLRFKAHRDFGDPKSLRIKKRNGKYTISFCYEDGKDDSVSTPTEHLKYLSGASEAELSAMTIGVDRGVIIPVHTGNEQFDFTQQQKFSKKRTTVSIKVFQKKLSRQKKGSNQRAKTKRRLARKHEKLANIRNEFAHQTSHRIVANKTTRVIIFEDLKTDKLVRKPKPKKDDKGRFIKNGAAAKAGLNKAILDKGWGQIANYCEYKAQRQGKAFFKVSASYTSQECAPCGHIHPDNRRSQSEFVCESCGHTDNADRNAALVIKKRGIKLILDSGTELSSRGVLTPGKHRARSLRKTEEAKTNSAMGNEASKERELALAA